VLGLLSGLASRFSDRLRRRLRRPDNETMSGDEQHRRQEPTGQHARQARARGRDELRVPSKQFHFRASFFETESTTCGFIVCGANEVCAFESQHLARRQRSDVAYDARQHLPVEVQGEVGEDDPSHCGRWRRVAAPSHHEPVGTRGAQHLAFLADKLDGSAHAAPTMVRSWRPRAAFVLGVVVFGTFPEARERRYRNALRFDF
jgi:hypothetical protein